MQMLFQGDLGKQKPAEVEKLFWESRDDVDDETRGFADDLHRLATRREEEVDALMLGFPSTPSAVVINETLEIAKRYAAPESLNFLNGVLDAIGRDLLEQKLREKPAGAFFPKA